MNLLIKIVKTPNGYSHRWSAHAIPNHKPTLMLVADFWDDYGGTTQFDVFLYLQDDKTYIGKTKIIHKCEDSGDNGYYFTKHLLEDEYWEDLADCCSLGQTVDYYVNLEKKLGADFKDVLKRLHDCGAYPQYQEDYEKHIWFHCLTREDSAERMLREAMYIVNGTDPVSNYTFTYSFRPKYADKPCQIKFSFERDKKLAIPRRIFAFIGKNGVGKTQMITKLPLDLSKKDKSLFGGKVPIFSKIMAASTCYYDNFKTPEGDKSNYVYCGLSKQENDNRQTLSRSEIQSNLITALKSISKKGRNTDYENRIVELLGNNKTSQEIASIYEVVNDEQGNEHIELNEKKTLKLFDRLSSGERIMVYLWSLLIANIRYDTLILFDEPETHLHPNAISELMIHLHSLLKHYDSYAIIVTHSPLVVRELRSCSVQVMERVENTLLTRLVGLETFGSDLSMLVDDIFGNDESIKLFETIVKEMVEAGKSYKEIEREIASEGIPLSLRLKMMIRTNCYLNDHAKDKALPRFEK